MRPIKTLIFTLLIPFLFLSASNAVDNYDIIVAADGSGNFTSLQEAINSCRAYRNEEKVIFIKNGVYREKVLIHSYLAHIHLIGENRDSTIITYDDHVGKGNTGTFSSYTLKVAGNSIIIENLTIENSSGRVGQAVALHAEGDCLIVKNCRLLGNQDTLYATGWLSRQYYFNCYIEGTVDFIFGAATAVFDSCNLHSKDDSFITAASTPEGEEFGFVFLNCSLTADAGVKNVYLGRPWSDFARVVFIACRMEDHIAPGGWHNWDQPQREKTSFYAEYGCTGPGSSIKERVSWSKQITCKESKIYTVENIFTLYNRWNPVK
jgi:pectinesterase